MGGVGFGKGGVPMPHPGFGLLRTVLHSSTFTLFTCGMELEMQRCRWRWHGHCPQLEG